jgi:tetratricopeptide (TPR) repeat protein
LHVVAVRRALVVVALALGGCARQAADLGREALARGDEAEARRQLARAIEHAPDDATLWRDLARAHLRMGDPEAARAAITRAAARAPEDPSVVLLRGQIRVATSDRAGAAADARWVLSRLRSAGALEELAVLFVRLGDAPSALAAGRAAVEASGFAADAYTNLAVLAVELRDFRAAARAFDEGRDRHPRNVPLREAEAAFLLSRGDLRGALAAYDALLPLHRRPGLVHLGMALVAHELGDLDAALGHARAAVKLEGEARPDVHYTHAIVLRDRGELDEARRVVRRARARFAGDDALARLEAEL